MITNISNYFSNLNNAGQALFVVGILLIITFIVLLVVVFKPDKNKVKKIYSESPVTDKENIFEEKMKNIDNIGIEDINIENDRTRNLKSIVDELRHVETKNTPVMDRIEKYEDEQEDTAIISVEELLKSNNSSNSLEKTQVYKQPLINNNIKDDDFIYMEDVSDEQIMPKKEEKKYTPKREIFSSVFAESTKSEETNEAFLNSLKEFRSNL